MKLFSHIGFGDQKMFVKKYYDVRTGSNAFNPVIEVKDFHLNSVRLVKVTFSRN